MLSLFQKLLIAYTSGVVAAISPCVIVLIPLLLYRFLSNTTTGNNAPKNWLGRLLDYLRFAISSDFLKFVCGFEVTYIIFGLFLSKLLTSSIQNGFKMGLGGFFIVISILSILNRVDPLHLPLFSNTYLMGICFALVLSINPCTIPFLAVIVSLSLNEALLGLFAFAQGLLTPALFFIIFGRTAFRAFKSKIPFQLVNKIKVGASCMLLGSGFYLLYSIRYISQWDLFIATAFAIMTILITGQSFEIISFASMFPNSSSKQENSVINKSDDNNTALGTSDNSVQTSTATLGTSVAISITIEDNDISCKNSSMKGYSVLSFSVIVLLMLLFGCGNGTHNEQIHREVSIALGLQHPAPLAPVIPKQSIEPISEEEIYRLLGLDLPPKTLNNEKRNGSSNPSVEVHSILEEETLLALNETEADEVIGNENCIDLGLLPPCFSCLWCLRAYLMLFMLWGIGIVGVHLHLQAKESVLPLAQINQCRRSLLPLIKLIWFKE